MRLGKLFILCVSENKSLKKYPITELTQYNEIASKCKDGYYIYELKKQQNV